MKGVAVERCVEGWMWDAPGNTAPAIVALRKLREAAAEVLKDAVAEQFPFGLG